MSDELAYQEIASPPPRDTGKDGFSRWGRRVIVALFHLVRYFVAGCVTGVAVAILPLISIAALAGLSALFLLLSYVGFLLGAPLDGGETAVFWFIVAPISLLVFTVIPALLTLVLAAAYTVIGPLPVALLVELVFAFRADKGLSFAGVLARLVSFAVAGAVLGVVVGGVGLVVGQLEVSLGVGVAYTGAVLMSVGPVFLFGLVLTLTLVAKEPLLAWWRRSSRKRTAG